MVLCLGLTACSGSNDIIGADWRTWGITRDGGTITCGGEEISVLVCVNKMNATLYYDTEDQTPFGWVDYPITFGDDVWDLFKGIDFSDLNGDGDSDGPCGSMAISHWCGTGTRGVFEYQPDKPPPATEGAQMRSIMSCWSGFTPWRPTRAVTWTMWRTESMVSWRQPRVWGMMP
ncbi:MAG: hypothetical protein ACLU8D_04845 [Enterocloster sp.]